MKVLRFAVEVAALLMVLLSLGCATQVHKSAQDIHLRENTERILLMPMDIELSALTAGGVLEPNAAWTSDARIYVRQAISEKMAALNKARLVDLETEAIQLDDREQKLQVQLIKLHEVVGGTILIHNYLPYFKLPNKTDALDWTLGEEARFLKEKFGTDYALFVYLRDSYSTAGRVAVIIVAAAVGASVPGGQQVGFASLVDLDTGQVIWFNRLYRGVGDLRNRENAASSVDLLLADFPD